MEKLKNLTKDYFLNNLLYVEIKTQDPYYLFGKFGAMAYPLKKSQVEKLDVNAIVYYLCTMGAGKNWKTKNGKTATDLNGKMFYITAAELKKWIDKNKGNSFYIKGPGTKEERIMVHFNKLTYIGKIDAETMKDSGVNNFGSSSYVDNEKVGRRQDWKDITGDKGYIGEKLFQREYFEKVSRVTKVIVTADLPFQEAKYEATDIIVELEKKR